MCGATPGAMRGSDFGEAEPYVVPAEEDAGSVLDTVKAVLLLWLASLTDEEEATEFPAAPGTVETE
jgi:hypothetical protein